MSTLNTNYDLDLISSLAQSTFLTNQNSVATNSVNVSSDYAKILAEKISEVETEFEETENNLSNQNQSSGGGESSSANSVETVKRFMPDGSILITTYDGSSILQQTKLRPHLVPVADYSAPPTSTGEPEMKFEAKQNLDLLSLLM